MSSSEWIYLFDIYIKTSFETSSTKSCDIWFNIFLILSLAYSFRKKDSSFSNLFPSNGKNIIHILFCSHEYSTELWLNLNPQNMYLNHNQRKLWNRTVNEIFKIWVSHQFSKGLSAFHWNSNNKKIIAFQFVDYRLI